jgi:Kef-type K+ transport system membrane component KefB
VNGILSVGLILLAALVAGRIAHAIRVPEVTGYLVIGLLIGPSGVNIVSADNQQALEFLSEVALGMILFSIGTVFEASALRRAGRSVAILTVSETGCAFVLVCGGLLLAGLGAGPALLLGVIAMETAPATTLMVLREYDAKGPLTDSLTALLGVNNMIVLASYGVAAAVLGFAVQATAPSVYASIYGVVWGILGSLAYGALLGLVLDAWSGRIRESGEAMILSIGIVLVAVGGARLLNVSPLFVTMAMGATLVNTKGRSDDLIETLRHADPPLYAAFFVLAGAELRVSMLTSVGAIGVAYVILRTAGKLGGAMLAARFTSLPQSARRQIGFCVLSSSSLAIGLSIQVRDAFPMFAAETTAVVLGAVILFEIIGPLLTRTALLRAGEIEAA